MTCPTLPAPRPTRVDDSLPSLADARTVPIRPVSPPPRVAPPPAPTPPTRRRVGRVVDVPALVATSVTAASAALLGLGTAEVVAASLPALGVLTAACWTATRDRHSR